MSPRLPRTFAPVLSLATVATVLFAPAPASRQEGSDTSQFVSALSRGPLVAAGVAFAGGLLTSMTPCVWPMIAITVSVFGAQETKSRAQGAALSASFVLGMAPPSSPDSASGAR